MTQPDSNTSKSLLLLGVVLVITISTTFIPAKWFGIKPIRTHKSLDLVSINKMGELAQDKNNNNNPDWRDLLNETVSASASTSELIKSTPIDTEAQKRLDDPNNLTGSFSKNLYIASAYLEKNGVTNTQTQQEVLNQIVAQEATKITPGVYTYQDLNISQKETKSTLKTYGNTLAPILQEVLTKKIITDDLTSINAFTQTKNDADLSTLIKNKKRVDVLLQKLLMISVPPSSVSYHLLALNRIALYRDLLDNLSKASVDPVRATLAINQYANTVVMVLRLPAQFYNYFNNENIVFLPKDSGYMFTTGYTVSN